MYTTVGEQSIRLSGAVLFKQFETSLPKFDDLDAKSYLKFVKAIHLLAAKYAISHENLADHCLEYYYPTLERLTELHGEYIQRDMLIASAILTIKMHILSYYNDDWDSKLVHTLTGLHMYYSSGEAERHVMSQH